MKNRLKIITFIAVIILASILYIYFAKYSISEITPENYIENLEQNKNETILRHETTNYLECDYFLIQANTIVTRENEQKVIGDYKLTFSEGNLNPYIEIINAKNHIGYTINYNEKNIPFGYSVFEFPFSENSGMVKQYLKKVLDNNELRVCKSKDKSFDILIKDFGENFLIYTVQGHLEDPTSIWFGIYKKRKYFKTLE